MNDINHVLQELEHDLEVIHIKHPRMKRQVRCEAKKAEYKKWKSAAREQWKLRQVCYDEPKVKIDHPYARGVDRYFRLSERLKSNLHYPKICEVFKHVNVKQYCRRGDFLQKKDKRWLEIEHSVRGVSLKELCSLKLSEELLFCFVTHTGKPVGSYSEVWRLRADRYSRKLAFRYLDFCEQVVEPHIVTHKPVLLPEVNAEIDREHIWQKLARKSWRSEYIRSREKLIDSYHRQQIEETRLDYEQRKTSTINQKGMEQSVPFWLLCIYGQ